MKFLSFILQNIQVEIAVIEENIITQLYNLSINDIYYNLFILY